MCEWVSSWSAFTWLLPIGPTDPILQVGRVLIIFNLESQKAILSLKTLSSCTLSSRQLTTLDLFFTTFLQGLIKSLASAESKFVMSEVRNLGDNPHTLIFIVITWIVITMASSLQWHRFPEGTSFGDSLLPRGLWKNKTFCCILNLLF